MLTTCSRFCPTTGNKQCERILVSAWWTDLLQLVYRSVTTSAFLRACELFLQSHLGSTYHKLHHVSSSQVTCSNKLKLSACTHCRTFYHQNRKPFLKMVDSLLSQDRRISLSYLRFRYTSHGSYSSWQGYTHLDKKTIRRKIIITIITFTITIITTTITIIIRSYRAILTSWTCRFFTYHKHHHFSFQPIDHFCMTLPSLRTRWGMFHRQSHRPHQRPGDNYVHPGTCIWLFVYLRSIDCIWNISWNCTNLWKKNTQ